MNYNKHLVYKRIVTLQSFRAAWICFVTYLGNGSRNYAHSKDKIYEITKRFKSSDDKFDCSVTFLCNEGLPQVLDFDLFDVEIRLLSVKDVKRYIAECNSYGMNCPKFNRNEDK